MHWQMEDFGERRVRVLVADAVDTTGVGDVAAWLRQASHPGVAELRGEGSGRRLVTTGVDGPGLEDMAPLEEETAAGVGAALATTLADLHTMGVVHGEVAPAAVVLDDGRRPVLLPPLHPPAAGGDPAADTVAVATVVAAVLGPVPGRRLGRVLERAGRGRYRRADDLASALLDAVPDARLPGVPAPGGPIHPPTVRDAGRRPPARRSSRLLLGFGVLAVVLALGVVAATHVGGGRTTAAAVTRRGTPVARAHPTPPATRSSAPTTTAPTTDPCPEVDLGCGPLRSAAVMRTGHGTYRSDLRRAVVVLGRWWCQARPLPVALAGEEVWVWGSWPSSAAVPATPVGLVPGATSLRTVAGAGGCDALEVLRTGRPAVVLDVGSVQRG